MNEKTVINKLKNIDEHLSCMKYRLNITTGFKYEEYEKGDSFHTVCLSRNYIVFFLEGTYTLSCGKFHDKTFEKDQMICLPKEEQLYAEALTKGRVIFMGFDTPESPCDKQVFTDYLSCCNEDTYQMEATQIIFPLTSFLKLLEYYLHNEINCMHLHQMKHKEFFLLLRGFYAKEQVANLLYPSIYNLSEFKCFMKTNFHKFDSIDLLVKRSNYSRAAFYRKFKEEFGNISPQAWMAQQRKPQMLEVASIPGMCAKEMMCQMNINSISTLERLCYDLFKCTPTQLIKQNYSCASQIKVEDSEAC